MSINSEGQISQYKYKSTNAAIITYCTCSTTSHLCVLTFQHLIDVVVQVVDS